MAMQLHEERRAIYGDTLSASVSSLHVLDEATQLVTLQASYTRMADARAYLHELPQDDCLLTLTTGNKRFYLHDRKPATISTGHVQLLVKSMRELKLEADQLQRQQAAVKASPSAAASHGPGASASATGQLWVDKYAPKSFIQLLSPERTNRSVLLALKRWDRHVFKRDTLPEAVDGRERDPKDSRPFQKVIMLAGPPGTGKVRNTCLAAKLLCEEDMFLSHQLSNCLWIYLTFEWEVLRHTTLASVFVCLCACCYCQFTDALPPLWSVFLRTPIFLELIASRRPL